MFEEKSEVTVVGPFVLPDWLRTSAFPMRRFAFHDIRVAVMGKRT